MIGKTVWYHPGPDDEVLFGDGPLGAIIVRVRDCVCIDIAVCTKNGDTVKRIVALRQADDPMPNFSHASWMGT